MKRFLFILLLVCYSTGYSQNKHHEFNVTCEILDLDVTGFVDGEVSKHRAIISMWGKAEGLEEGDTFQLYFYFKQGHKENNEDMYRIMIATPRSIGLDTNHDVYRDSNYVTVNQGFPRKEDSKKIEYKVQHGPEFSLSKYSISSYGIDDLFLARRIGRNEWQMNLYVRREFGESVSFDENGKLESQIVTHTINAICKNMPYQYQIMIDDIAEFHNFTYTR
mgnify:CR=1 FL=1